MGLCEIRIILIGIQFIGICGIFLTVIFLTWDIFKHELFLGGPS